MIKIKLIRLLLFVTLAVFSFKLNAQQSHLTKEEAIERVLAYFAENEASSVDYNEYSAKLSKIYDDPIDLNKCTNEEMASLEILSAIQIINIVNYRKLSQGFASLYELRLIEGLTKEQALLILPFVKVSEVERLSPQITPKNLLKMGKHSIIARYQRVIEPQAAYLPDEDGNVTYLGSPDRLYAKYKFQFTNKLSAGITADKDAGEPFFKSPNAQGFDYYSGFIELENQGIIKSMVLGDYTLQFGQGLALWNGFGMGKSSMVSNVAKIGKGLDHYSSTDENNFFRGIATTVKWKKIELTAFYSKKMIDGNVDTIDEGLQDGLDYISSFDETGLHATTNDFASKDAIGQQVFGANLGLLLSRGKVGFTWVDYRFSSNFTPSTQLYKLYQFSGDHQYNSSVNYQWNLNHIFVSGEIAVDGNGHVAVSNNAVFNLSSKLGVGVLHRYFDKSYQALYAAAFAEGSAVQNEQGMYLGVNWLVSSSWTINAYVDFYEFPWLKYQISKPSTGLDYFATFEYMPSSHFNFYVRYKYEQKLKDIASDGVYTKQQLNTEKQQLRFNVAYGDPASFSMKSRLEWSWYEHDDKQSGVLAFQDFSYRWAKFPLKTSLRFLMFDVNGYDARIYTFENDLLYNYATPSFSGKGIRTYALFQYELTQNIDLWFKYGITIYSDRNVISSGDTEIQGNSKSEIKFQIRWKF